MTAVNGDSLDTFAKMEDTVVTRQQFLLHFQAIVEKLTNESSHADPRTRDVFVRAKYILEYNVPDGKLTRGMTVVQSYLSLCEHTPDSAELRRVYYLGWAVEIMQSFFLIADDIMDQSTTRRGKPCWYKRPEIGLDSINDSFFLEHLIFILLRSEFEDKPYYLDLVHAFHDVIFQTVVGQTLDLVTAPVGKVNFENFTEVRYNAIVTYKTAYYTIYLPVLLAMIVCGKNSPELRTQVLEISLLIGRFFQIQDDFLDAYGDPAVTGKIGTDIEDNKCSWLIIQALKIATADQKASLVENYASQEKSKIEAVKQLYTQLDLPTLYREFEEKANLEVQEKLPLFTDSRFADIFSGLWRKLYKRYK